MREIDVAFDSVRKDESFFCPKYGTDGSAGMDLCASEDVVLRPGDIVMVPTNLRAHIPTGYHARIEARSGLASRGLVVLTGVVDEDYRGEWKVILHFTGPTKTNGYVESWQIHKGDRIAQAVFRESVRVTPRIREVSTETARGTGGFGSTGAR